MRTGATIHEAGGLDSNHDVELFRAWKRAMPGLSWTRAVVDRYDGLTLFTDGEHVSGLHFSHALCGYSGSGPNATAEILHEAGFGDLEKLKLEVSGVRGRLSLVR